MSFSTVPSRYSPSIGEDEELLTSAQKTEKMDFSEDDPAAVKSMIEFFYNFKYGHAPPEPQFESSSGNEGSYSKNGEASEDWSASFSRPETSHPLTNKKIERRSSVPSSSSKPWVYPKFPTIEPDDSGFIFANRRSLKVSIST